MNTIKMPESAIADMSRLKLYFPFRIVWGAVNPSTGDALTGASPTKRQVNDLIRKGWLAWTV